MSNTATRLITLIMLLQRRPNQKAAELAEALGVSVRSVHRYMTMLDEMGIPVYSERGPQGGFSLVRGYKMPPLVFTPGEATALALGAGLAAEVWGSLYAEAARGALAKLDNVLPDEQQGEVAWARRSLVALGLHRVPIDAMQPYLTLLRQAVHEQRPVSLTYQGRGRALPTERRVDPYALVHRWGWWYVAGFCHLRQGIRSFRLDRILALTLQDETFTRPDDFDIQTYLATEMQFPATLRVRMRFVPEAAALASDNRSYWDSLEPQPDGSVVVTFHTPDVTWAASVALSYGSLAEVEEPLDVRRTVHDWALAVAARHADTAGT